MRVRQPDRRRSGAAVVEMALVTPILACFFLIAVDCCRVFYYSQVVTTCCRNAAIYANDPYSATLSQYKTLTDAGRGDAGATLGPKLTVTSTTGTDTLGAYTVVTVSYPFKTITRYPGLPQNITLTRSAKVRPAPTTPNAVATGATP